MKTYETHATAFATGKEFSRAEVEEILDTLKIYQDRMALMIEVGERIFLMSGEMCGFEASELAAK
jgi:hypothetical protein